MSDSFKEDLRKEGYSKEEEYFYRINREIINNRRRYLDEKRAEQKSESSQASYWMKCPKCGNQMKEMSISNIYADQCTRCQGIFFDHAEFETFLESKLPRSFLKELLKRLRDQATRFDFDWRP
jgi:Zn-finger nucleic acid-binding protein